MKHETDESETVHPAADESGYVAPQIEKVVSPADLEREVHYAGVQDGVSLGQP